MSLADFAPYLGLLAALALGVWQARFRPRTDLDAGELALRQLERTDAQLRASQRETRKVERAYQELLAWAYGVQGQIAREAPGVKLPPLPLRTLNGDTPPGLPVTAQDEARLRRLLVERMEVEDLRTLAFDLGCEDLRGATQGEMARALLDYVRTRRLWPQMLKWLADNRPDIKG